MILKMPLKMAFEVAGLTGIWFPKLQSKIDAHIQETLCIYILSICLSQMLPWKYNEFHGRVKNALMSKLFHAGSVGPVAVLQHH